MPLLQARALLIAPVLPTCEAPAVVCFCAVPLSPSHHPLHLRKLCVPEIRVAKRLTGINQGAADRVSKVVLCARTMINTILPTSRRAALERHKLSAQSVIIK